jgi:ComEC/Rec2-related protein
MKGKIRKGDAAFFIAMAFLCGVFIVSLGWNIKLIGLFLLFLILLAFFFSKDLRIWKYIFIFFLAASTGTIYYLGYIRWISLHTHMPSGKETAFFGLVVEEPKPAGNFLMFPLELSRPYSGKIDVFASPHSQFHYGDILWIRGTIEASQDSDEDPVIFLPQLSVVTAGNGFWLKQWSVTARSFITQKFEMFFPSDKASLLTGIVTGSNASMSTELKDEMDTSGTSYVIGMYGYKIAVICLVIATLLKDFLPRRVLLILTLGIIWLFIFISGGTISAIRAGVMGSLVLIAAALGRIFVARNALTFTAFVLVVIDPRALTDAAFQLSFLSFLGIYYLGDPIRNFFHWTDKGWLEWKEHAMLALTTNLAIIPVVMKTFGGFSLTSFISNILIMLPWAVMLFLATVVILLGVIAPSMAFFGIQFLNILLSYELFVIRIFTKLMIPLPNIFTSDLVIILYYGLLLIFIYYYGETA